MIKVNKSGEPLSLSEFSNEYPDADWKQFRDFNQSINYHQTREQIFHDQGWMCAYCERQINIDDRLRQRVEHFHEKSDKDANYNVALHWKNLLGVCLGGSRESEKEVPRGQFEPDDNLSCDAIKGELKKSLGADFSGKIINPLEVDDRYLIFSLDNVTKKIVPNIENCQKVDGLLVYSHKYKDTTELVEKTIQYLNLNCDRLLYLRGEVIREHSIMKGRYFKARDKEGYRKEAERRLKTHRKSFVTLRRILFKELGEKFFE